MGTLFFAWIGLLSWTANSGHAFEFIPPPEPPLRQKASLRHTGSFRPQSATSLPGNRVSLHEESLVGTTPLWRTADELVSLSIKGAWVNFDSTLGNPSDLYVLSASLGYARYLEGERFWGATLSFGSASDHPFADSSVETLGSTVSYGFPQSKVSRWVLFVNYSNNRSFFSGVPLPGAVYAYVPDRTLRLMLGLPMVQVNWQVAAPWSVSIFALIPWMIKAHLIYTLGGPVQAYTGFESTQETFFLLNRTNRKDQFFIDEKRVLVGFRSPITDIFSGSLETGLAFARRSFQAESLFKSKAQRMEIDSAWFVQLGLNAGF